jgi:hypothetical protein
LTVLLTSIAWIDLTKKPGVLDWAGLLATMGGLAVYEITVFKWALRQSALPPPTA